MQNMGCMKEKGMVNIKQINNCNCDCDCDCCDDCC